MRLFASSGRFGRVACAGKQVGLLCALLASGAVLAATTVTYTYDEQGRLETSSSDNGTNATAVTYSYDRAGNRLGVTTAVFDTAKPSVPTGLSASAVSYSRINLSWNASSDTGGSGLAGYKIYRGGSQIATTSATSYSDTTVFGSQTYTYTVAAYDNAQNVSNQSSTASATTPPAPDTTPPSVPTGLTASAVSSTQVNLTWSASTDTGGSGLAGYRIYRGGTLIGTSSTASYSDTTTSGSTSYSYTVSAYDNASPPNVSGQSAAASVTTPDTLPPTVPAGLAASAPSSTQVHLTWNASSDPGGSGVAGYRVYRGGSYLGSTSTTSFNDTSVSGSTSYTYTVAAYDNASNTSAQSGAVGVTTPDTIAPSVPTGLAINNVYATQVSLYWNGSTDTGGSGLAGYKIYRNGSQIATTGSLTYTDTSVASSTTYTYAVAAYDNSGNTSAPSAGASVTTPAAYVQITDTNSGVLPAAASRYHWEQTCDYTGVPFCTSTLIKNGVGTVWSWTVYYGDPPGCPQGYGATGYQQIVGTCVIQAQTSVY